MLKILGGLRVKGFWAPLSYFDYIPNLELKEGSTFTELKGHEICNKYINPATLRAIKNAQKGKTQKATYRETPLFPMHEDTKQLKYFINSLPLGSTIYISEKLHGCVSTDTLVETQELGTVTIGSLVNSPPETLHVKSFNTETNEVEYAEVSDYYFLPDDGEWYEIELEDGTKLEITGNNPVWLPNEEKYVRVDELTGKEILLCN